MKKSSKMGFKKCYNTPRNENFGHMVVGQKTESQNIESKRPNEKDGMDKRPNNKKTECSKHHKKLNFTCFEHSVF
jgi:hypothetical protein